MKSGRTISFCDARIPTRSMIEKLEERELLSAAPLVHIPKGDTVASIIQALDHRNNIKTPFNIKITGVSVQNGALVASGLIGNNPITIPITLSLEPAAAAATADAVTPAAVTQVLNLHLNPINLDVLGLDVVTSPICLDITATSGPGNLLGNLLTSIANLLNGGSTLGSILGGLTGTQLTTLLNGLTGLLNGLFGALTSPASIGTPAATTGAVTNILHLSLGPVNLNLLGLGVHADNCSNGPITLDVNAIAGPSNLLGNLLTSLSNSLNSLPNQTLAQRILDNVVRDIFGLL